MRGHRIVGKGLSLGCPGQAQGDFQPVPQLPVQESGARRRGTRDATHGGGFTLVEVLIAVVISVIVMGTVYASYTATLRMAKDTAYERQIYGMGRLALGRMIRDFESVVPQYGAYRFRLAENDIASQGFSRVGLSARSLLLADKAAQTGVVWVEYKIEESGKEGMFVLRRLERRISGRDIGQEADETDHGYVICKNIKYYQIIVSDRNGKKYPVWDSLSGFPEQYNQLPARIQIRLGLIDRDRPDVIYPFQTEIYMPVTGMENETES